MFLTRTGWAEAPRIRHQLANLLAAAGHDVLFFEKPLMPWQRASPPRVAAPRIRLAQYREMVHHKLRLAPVLHKINAVYAARSLRAALAFAGAHDDAVIVNFNYDHWFVRDVFPRQRILTMINDDFLSTAVFGYSAPLRWALQRTCKTSDRVLTVSRPLKESLAEWCDAEIFRPWADRPYSLAASARARDALLFWGFINRRFDVTLVEKLSRDLAASHPGMRILVVGPVEPGAEMALARLASCGNVEILPATPLDSLPLDRVLAGLIPYQLIGAEKTAVDLPNKALQMLARGLPLVISGMPNFIDEPFVLRIDERPISEVVEHLTRRFDSLQPGIRGLVERNLEAARLEQFLRLAA